MTVFTINYKSVNITRLEQKTEPGLKSEPVFYSTFFLLDQNQNSLIYLEAEL